jgi:hypothetical protein
VYDFRHAAATMMIKARIPLAEAARRLGHSVEPLVSTCAFWDIVLSPGLPTRAPIGCAT